MSKCFKNTAACCWYCGENWQSLVAVKIWSWNFQESNHLSINLYDR